MRVTEDSRAVGVCPPEAKLKDPAKEPDGTIGYGTELVYAGQMLHFVQHDRGRHNHLHDCGDWGILCTEQKLVARSTGLLHHICGFNGA